MKKCIIFIVLSLLPVCDVLSQLPDGYLYRSEAGRVIANASYIQTFNVGHFSNITPYALFKSTEFNYDSKSIRVNMLRYKGWEGEKGDFEVVEIKQGDKLLLKFEDAESFIKPGSVLSSITNNDYFIRVSINSQTTALVFIGCTYASQPPMLTIAILNSDTATIVFNKKMVVETIEQGLNGFSMLLSDVYEEFDSSGVLCNTVKKAEIKLENGILQYRNL